MLYHHDSDTRTIVPYVRGLQGSRERWTVPTIMDGRGAARRGTERVNVIHDERERMPSRARDARPRDAKRPSLDPPTEEAPVEPPGRLPGRQSVE